MVFGPALGQVHPAVEEALKTGSRVGQVNTDSTVFDLASIAVVLSSGSDGVVATLVRS